MGSRRCRIGLTSTTAGEIPDARRDGACHARHVPRLEGSCHCGALRFAVDVGDDERDVLDCNCSICTRKGFLHLIVEEQHFTLLAGEPRIYTFGTHTAKHMFCARCGIQAFYRPRSHPNAWDVNARCLDVPLAYWRVHPFDGANWEQSVDAIR
jgi:hypothetical protein